MIKCSSEDDWYNRGLLNSVAIFIAGTSRNVLNHWQLDRSGEYLRWQYCTHQSNSLIAIFKGNTPLKSLRPVMRKAFHVMITSSNGNILRVTGEFPSQRPVKRSFDVSFHLCLNKPLSKQSWGWRFETTSRSLWRHCTTSAVPDSSTNHSSTDRISGQFLFYHDQHFIKREENLHFRRIAPLFVPTGVSVTTHDDGAASDVIGMWRHNQQATNHERNGEYWFSLPK